MLVAGVMMLALAWGIASFFGTANLGTWVLSSFLTLLAGALVLHGLFSRRKGKGR